MKSFAIILAASLFALPAYAYVGPGLGLGALGVIAGLFLSLVMAFLAFVWMPIKRVFSRNKPKADADSADEV